MSPPLIFLPTPSGIPLDIGRAGRSRASSPPSLVRCLLLGGALCLLLLPVEGPLLGGSLRAQDVELLGRIHGVQPPPGYYETMDRNPRAFEIGRGWQRRTGFRLQGDGPPPAGDDLTGRIQLAPAAVTGLGPRETPVSGTFEFPVLLGRFADTETVRYTRQDVQREFFDGPTTGGRRTLPEYYDAASNGHVELVGRSFDWGAATMDRSEVTGTSSGLGPDAEVGEFVRELLDAADGAGTDWSRFDNDGPDGIPDSGDDDGYVDLLAVLHPTEGAECGNPGSSTRIWSHRWQLSLATDSTEADPDPGAGRPYVTSSPSASTTSGSEYILVDDYMVAPLLECDWQDSDGADESDINQIGVLAHELGHGFGLPDLYGTGASSHFGAGNWDLMGTGAWGCDGNDPAVPCLPGAWTRAALGWVPVDTVSAGTSLAERTLDPVETSGGILRVESNDGSGEYFLMENRRRTGFDDRLLEEGVLIWHVDPSVLGARWTDNRVNADPEHPGVWLRQADGLNDLMREGGGRGDPGDAFTPQEGEDRFHASTSPSSHTHVGTASGFTLTGIRDAAPSFTVELESTYHGVTLTVDGTGTASGDFVVDGEGGYSPPAEVPAAAFQTLGIQAPPGRTTAPGIRDGFRGWEDGTPCPSREFVTPLSDSVLVASYGGSDVRYDVSLTGPEEGVEPGSVSLDPGCGSWVPQGTTVRVEVEARTGFEFVEWGGDFAGRDNPFFIESAGPREAEARFDLTYSVASNPTMVDLVAGTEQEIVLQVSNGNPPVTWSVVEGGLPPGLRLTAGGTLAGVALEEGSYPVGLRARDAIGLEAELNLDLSVEEPVLGLLSLAAPFLGGGDPPDEAQEAYLDWSGNRNTAYDIGDFRAYVQAHPDAPDTAPEAHSASAAEGAGPILVPAVELRSPPEEPSPGEVSEGRVPGAGSGGTETRDSPTGPEEGASSASSAGGGS